MNRIVALTLLACAISLFAPRPAGAGTIQIGAVLTIDTDGYGVNDLADIDPTHFNAAQIDFDSDGLGDDLEGKLSSRDSEFDGNFDYRDVDSDNDGKADISDPNHTVGNVAPAGRTLDIGGPNSFHTT